MRLESIRSALEVLSEALIDAARSASISESRSELVDAAVDVKLAIDHVNKAVQEEGNNARA